MAVLIDCAQKVTRLIAHANRVQGAYEVARNAYDQLDSDQPFDASWLTVAFQVGDQQVPLPVPQDRATLQSYFLESINYLAGQLAQIWEEIHITTTTAVEHIHQAAARADASVIQAPPAIAPFPAPSAFVSPPPTNRPIPSPPTAHAFPEGVPQQSRPAPPAQPPQPQQGLPASIQLPPAGMRIPTVAVQ